MRDCTVPGRWTRGTNVGRRALSCGGVAGKNPTSTPPRPLWSRWSFPRPNSCLSRAGHRRAQRRGSCNAHVNFFGTWPGPCPTGLGGCGRTSTRTRSRAARSNAPIRPWRPPPSPFQSPRALELQVLVCRSRPNCPTRLWPHEYSWPARVTARKWYPPVPQDTEWKRCSGTMGTGTRMLARTRVPVYSACPTRTICRPGRCQCTKRCRRQCRSSSTLPTGTNRYRPWNHFPAARRRRTRSKDLRPVAHKGKRVPAKNIVVVWIVSAWSRVLSG